MAGMKGCLLARVMGMVAGAHRNGPVHALLVLTAWRLLLATMYSDGGGELRAHRQGAGAALLGGRGRRVLRTDLPPAGA